ncbi:MAG: F0F1 ATP synthase subunit B [Actinomycetota bacterium]|nr:F0F1 ATP synthase subunit B [Actinomycetota bacterium]MDA8279400.1 F0F1 ATP synthase subunit B [Actinomycetota bacterium]
MIASSNFLVPNGTLIVEIVAFLIVLFVIGKYVLPPLNRTLEERQQQIRASLAQAEEARAEADETRAQRQQILDEARQQAREVVAQANATAERLRTEAVDRAQQEHDRILAAAEDEIAAARRRAVEEVSAQLGALAMAVARQVVGREVDASAHRALIDEAVAALQASSDAAATQS